MSHNYFSILLDRAHDRWRDRILTGLTVLMLIHLFVVAPLEAHQAFYLRPVGMLSIALLAVGLLVLSRSFVPVAGIILVVGLLAAALVLRGLGGHPELDVSLQATAWLLIALVIMWVVARAVYEPGRITYHRVLGSIMLYLTIGLLFVALYTLVGAIVPNAFNGLSVAPRVSLPSDLVYFSFITLTTVGYGDVVPVHPVARSLANVEAIIGQLYPATVLARLVSLGQEQAKE
jgi:Ion channel